MLRHFLALIVGHRQAALGVNSVQHCAETLPGAHLTASLNRGWTLRNGAPTNDLPATLSPSGVTFTLLFLATKLFPKRPALGLISVDMLVNRFVANRQRGGDLLGAPLQTQPLSNQRPGSFIDTTSITTRLASLLVTLVSLLGSVTAITCVARKLPADRRLVSTQQFGNLDGQMSCFHKRINLLTFSLAEMFVAHKVTLTWRSGNLRC